MLCNTLSRTLSIMSITKSFPGEGGGVSAGLLGCTAIVILCLVNNLMPSREAHDAPSPASWPDGVVYLTKARLTPAFPSSLIPLLYPSTQQTKFTPKPTAHPDKVQIKRISQPEHPANGQYGLFAKKKVPANELIIPYLGVIHHSLLPVDGEAVPDEHTDSDYDLSLLRLSATEFQNPFPGCHLSIGVDAAQAGNAARFINDYRGCGAAANAEFRLGSGEAGELRMEVWSLQTLNKRGEVLVSYGKGWWDSRKS